MLFPCVFQTSSHKNEIIIAQHFYIIADDSSVACTVLYEVNLHFCMAVKRIRMKLLVPLRKMIAVLFRQPGYFRNNVVHCVFVK